MFLAPPANYVTCNYVEGGDHCYYLDNAASGITIEGGVCLRTRDGVKTNIGKKWVVILRRLTKWMVESCEVVCNWTQWIGRIQHAVIYNELRTSLGEVGDWGQREREQERERERERGGGRAGWEKWLEVRGKGETK